MHHRSDRVIYVMKGGKIRLSFGDEIHDKEIKAGSVTFGKAPDHEVKNIGNTTIGFTMTELKK